MDLLHIIGKKRSDTGSIMRLFAEDMQQIGGVDVRHRFNQGFLKGYLRKPVYDIFIESH
jgi:hypothetical protein